MNAKELLTSPLTAITTILSFLAHLAGLFEPVAHAIWATVGTWYPAVAISSSTIIPMIGAVSVPFIGLVDLATLAQSVSIVGALIYVAYLGDKTLDRFSQQTE